MASNAQRRWISGADLASEPFRLFFPAGVVAGLVGVSLWPLHLLGLKEFYPGTSHARIMVFGFFAAFIFGFLGTAMPRMLSTRPFRRFEIFPLFMVHTTMVVAFAFDRLVLGDALFLVLLAGFVTCIVPRLKERQDTPPPGFVLVGFAFASVASGALTGLILHYVEEPTFFWITLQKLLAYQGFVLLPILGIGPLILPRLFGRESSHNFPESLAFPPGWGRKAALAAITGFVIFASFLVEAGGWIRTGNGLRFLTVLAYLSLELPLRSAAGTNALGLMHPSRVCRSPRGLSRGDGMAGLPRRSPPLHARGWICPCDGRRCNPRRLRSQRPACEAEGAQYMAPCVGSPDADWNGNQD